MRIAAAEDAAATAAADEAVAVAVAAAAAAAADEEIAVAGINPRATRRARRTSANEIYWSGVPGAPDSSGAWAAARIDCNVQ